MAGAYAADAASGLRDGTPDCGRPIDVPLGASDATSAAPWAAPQPGPILRMLQRRPCCRTIALRLSDMALDPDKYCRDLQSQGAGPLIAGPLLATRR